MSTLNHRTDIEPNCTHQEHQWRRGEVEEVGGCRENPGVFSCPDDRMEILEVCDHCGVIRTTDEPGLCAHDQNTYVSYQEGS